MRWKPATIMVMALTLACSACNGYAENVDSPPQALAFLTIQRDSGFPELFVAPCGLIEGALITVKDVKPSGDTHVLWRFKLMQDGARKALAIRPGNLGRSVTAVTNFDEDAWKKVAAADSINVDAGRPTIVTDFLRARRDSIPTVPAARASDGNMRQVMEINSEVTDYCTAIG